MKKRPLWIGFSGLVALTGAWLLSPGLRAASFDAFLQHAPLSGRLWAVDQLEAIGSEGEPALINALGQEEIKVARAASRALVRRRATTALAYGLRADAALIRLRAAETAIAVLEGEPGPSKGAVYLSFDSEEEIDDKAAAVSALSAEDRAFVEALIPAVLQGLDDSYPRVRGSCLRILTFLPERAAPFIPRMIAELDSEDSFLRESAEDALAAQGSRALEPIAAALPKFIDRFLRLPATRPEDVFQGEEEPVSLRSQGQTLSFEVDPRLSAIEWSLYQLRRRRLADAEAIARLLDSPHDEVWESATDALLALGDPGYRALIARLVGPAESSIYRTLSNELPADRGALLLEALSSKNIELRRRALALLAERDPVAEASPLLALFDDPKPELRLAAIAVCEAWGAYFPAGRPALLKTAKSGEALERVAALRALAAFKLDKAERLALFRSALSAEEGAVREVGAEGLGELGELAASEVPALFVALEDSDRAVRVRAFDALLSLGAFSGPRFLAELDAGEARVRSRAATALGSLDPRPKGAAARLLLRLKDADATVREKAAWALGEIGDNTEKTLAGLRSLLKDPSELVRQEAADALELLGVAWQR